MCGIAGILGRNDSRLMRRMIEAIKHRGPDGQGYYKNTNQSMLLASCRLSIIDLQGGSQPVFNETHNKCIVFNGEIYNYKELRGKLQAKGHLFTTHSDTEVIIHLYEEYGPRCVEYLHGMFAFAIADGDTLFLARDRLGIKPLYYAFLPEKNLFIFASEIKALLQCEELDVTLNMQAFVDSIVFFYPVGELTFFKDILEFQPGHTLLATQRENGQIELHDQRYYALELTPDAGISFAQAQEELAARIHSAVASHLQADVEVGISLSGGSIRAFWRWRCGNRTLLAAC
ncbi:asparagine synthase (glutamine-hydrolyzing) [Ktedonosporobacter rubrisoli]|uniref:asparagine synthase (glutamine-hydrolyzing) n=1 Tax=Ktedonosporobacter rubrisoli TaxID=2509675 RepID=A0A4P6JKM4_KTERU|nr:asparagine synthase (glutamine-hydrolyzing) [Ktedonosporobacter rubrisoli]QBD75719.1 asparagine synthase (glutamine-hydrolyzing) [Ktedonosporobacter rubrisoli]